VLTIYEGRFGLQLDPTKISRVEDVYDADWTRYARVHFKWFGNYGGPANPCTILDKDGEVHDALVKAGVQAA
jgi:hypothetical protein